MSLKKNLRLVVAIVPLLAISIMGNSVADAAVATDGKTATTAANLTLLAKSGPVDPLDPTKPVQPINPVTPTTGDLRIDYISDLHFGTQEISGNQKNYYAAFDKVADLTGHRDEATGEWVTDKLTDADYRDVPNYVQVTNNTTGNWSLKVSNTPFKSGANELKGTVLTINEVASKTDNGDPDAGLFTDSILLKGDGVSDQIVDQDGNTNPTGTWTIAMGTATPGSKAVKLTVPGPAEKVAGETYTSTLNWTLTAAP
ncbi:WxL domain-containing protein [Dellaglioa sp. P0083]|uniref:WxL domain-containing protein n=1 Tax=Dellaglioa kimchii TaxID=3344667 RepID=UPI0038D368E7